MTDPIQIAVIGMGCRLPGGASDPEKLWKLLAEGRSGWKEVPADRWKWKSFYHPNPEAKEAINSRSGYFLDEDVAAFDARFFSIPTWEAHGMDPQQRILLETTYEALENAGIPLQSIRGSDTSVYVGLYTRDYDRMGYKDLPEITKVHITGSGEAVVANRISYLFDLKGASLTIDTGCSGSMVALHQACLSLRAGESTMAIVGGTQLLLHPDQTIPMSMVGMVNPNGRCYVFDERGSGYARGEGVGTIILKRLEDALDAGDPIHAIIRNSALNQDGKTAGISLPSSDAQAALMKRVYVNARLDPQDTPYVEAHGTGTQAGDNAEISSISQIFCSAEREHPLYVGSVKSNIGHLEASSGIAGLIKSVMMLKKGLIPPNLDFVTPKPILRLAERNIKIPIELTPLPEVDATGTRRISLNSFGYGGTNAHVILQSAPFLDRSSRPLTNGRIPQPNGDNWNQEPHSAGGDLSNSMPNGVVSASNGEIQHSVSPNLFVLTASCDKSLRTNIENLKSYISEDPHTLNLQDLSHTLTERRSIFPLRFTAVATTTEELAALLGEKSPRISRVASNIQLTFVFTGQGAQWPTMGRELLHRNGAFKSSILKSECFLKEEGCNWSLLDELVKDGSSSRIGESEISQPATTALQIALVDLLLSFCVQPNFVCGHSSGEIAAAYAAGMLSHKAAIQTAYRRGIWSSAAKKLNSSKGSMMAVGVGETEALHYIEQVKTGLAVVACVNSPYSTTISGDEAAIDELKTILDKESKFARKLAVDTAYHSHHMRKVSKQYFESLTCSKPGLTQKNIRFFSSVTGSEKTSDFDASYWTQNLVSKVRFSEAIQLLAQKSANSKNSNIFIEIGPHSALAGPLRQIMTNQNIKYTYLPAFIRGQDAIRTVLGMAGQLFENGYSIDLKATTVLTLSATQPKVISNLAPYAWDHSISFWHESRLSREHRLREFPYHDLLGLLDVHSNIFEPRWRYHISVDTIPWIKDHVIEGSMIFPGSGYLCMAIEAMRQITQIRKTSGSPSKFVLKDISFSKPIVVPEPPLDGFTPEIEVQLTLSPAQKTSSRWEIFRIFSLSTDGSWSEHCSGQISLTMASKTDELEGSREADFAKSQQLENLEDMKSVCNISIQNTQFYEDLKLSGNDFGTTFRALGDIKFGRCKAYGRLQIPNVAAHMPRCYMEPHVIHPATLDAINQMLAALFKRHCTNSPLMPVFIGMVSVSADIGTRPGDELLVTTDITPEGLRSSTGNSWAFQKNQDSTLSLVVSTLNLRLRGIGDAQTDDIDFPFLRKMAYTLEWEPAAALTANPSDPTTKEGDGYKQLLGPALHILKDSKSDILSTFETNLSRSLVGQKMSLSSSSLNKLPLDPDILYIVLDDLSDPLLLDPSPERFESLKLLFLSTKSIIWVSTRNFNSIGEVANQGLVTGVARVARRENEGLRFVTLDIYNNTGEVMDKTIQVIRSCFWPLNKEEKSNEHEFIIQNGTLLVPRLKTASRFDDWVHRGLNSSNLEPTLYQQSERPLKLEVGTPGLLSSLRFVDDPDASAPLEAEQIRIEARAYGINFKDVFIALGQMLPGVNMVGEVAGIITDVGSSMLTRFKVGDRVAAVGARPFASLAVVSGWQACILPDKIPFTLGASIPTVFLTAYQSIVEVARFRRGQTILIHAASGGVGQAAIMLAQNIGASQIFATVGSVAKRQLLTEKYNIPESHIFSSRSRTFKQGVLRLTANKGVDVVINSLSGEWLSDTWECIARLGKFVEIGKADIYNRGQLSMVPFDRSATFAAVDLVVLFEEEPENMTVRFARIMSMFEQGILKSLEPVTITPISSIEDAFRLISGRKHTGKVVVDVEPQVTLVNAVSAMPKALELDSEASYVIAGGLGDLGRRICRLLALRGARHVVTLSRRKLSAEFRQQLVAEMQELGAALHIIECDILDSIKVHEAAAYCKRNLPSVGGVIHAGMILRDHPLEQMSLDDYQTGIAPKVRGTLNLDEAFGSSRLKFFITLSSVSCILGKTGQLNYSAGNAFQDAFANAHDPRSHTQYVSLNLGAIDGSEAITSLPIRQQELMRQGAVLMKFEELFKALEYSMGPEARQHQCAQLIFGFDRTSMETVGDTIGLDNPMFSLLPQLQINDGASVPLEKIDIEAAIRKAGDINEATAIISNAIIEKFSLFLNRAIEEIDPDSPPASFGLDSLVSIELKNWMVRTFKTQLQTSELGSASSIVVLAKNIASKSKLITNGTSKAEEEGISRVATTSEAQVPSEKHPAKFSEIFDEVKCCQNVKPFPKYPLMSLDSALQLLLKDVEPFASAKEITEISQAIDEFKTPGGAGIRAYQTLVDRSNDSTIDNWLYDLQVEGVWLRRQAPLVPYQHFLSTHYDSNVPQTQAERAAIIASTVFKLKQELTVGKVEPNHYFGIQSCMYTWQWQFNSLREPGIGKDEMRKYTSHDHCVVLRRGRVFRVMLKDGDEAVSCASLKSIFEAILNRVQDRGSWAGILTADERTSWAEIRKKLQTMSPSNREYLHVIESAAFLICLDDGAPDNGRKRIQQYLLGDGFNRWNDKGIQFIVCGNGASAGLYEHTMIDGLTNVEMNNRIHKAVETYSPVVNGSSKDIKIDLEEYTLSTIPEIDSHISTLKSKYISYTSRRDFDNHTISSLGSTFLANHNCPIKAVFDIVIQLAVRLYFGYNPPSWEPVSMAAYHKGRFAITQVVTKSIIEFCATVFDADVPLASKRNMLLKAADDYNNQIRTCYNGNAYFRLMNALRTVWPKVEPLASLFSHPAWIKTHPNLIMTNMTDGSALDSAYVMGNDDSIWVSYSVSDTEAKFCIVGPAGGEVSKFKGMLDKAAAVVKGLVEGK